MFFVKFAFPASVACLSLAVFAADIQMTPVGGATVSVVQSAPEYNSWPMVQSLGDKVVCAYSRGSAHTIHEGRRGVYARTSLDGGRTWGDEICVVNDPAVGEVTIGKGVDGNGAMLLWVRRWGVCKGHDLYRTKDGISFDKISSPSFSPMPMQVTDVFHVPGKGMMSLWFAGEYRNKTDGHSWGTLTSTDNGRTWVQRTVEGNLPKSEWPTEQCAVHIGEGRILAIARSEGGGGQQFQITSTDYGVTWKRARTNIKDVRESTPSLICDPKTGKLFNYYYQRGAKKLKRRVVSADFIFSRPGEWPMPETIAQGNEARAYDAGNVNATVFGDRHLMALYTGTTSDTSVFVVEAPPLRKTKVVFFFDTEDFIQPRSCDAIRDMANVLASEGVKGHFALVGYLGKKLVDWRRFDVIDALKNHHIGTQTLYHSLHPNITESTDIEDFDAAYLHAMDEESKGIGMLMAATGAERMWCSVLPGNGNTMVALYLYANLGIPFFGGGTGVYEDVTKCGDIWYCNQRHLTYAYSLHLESFLPGRETGDIGKKLDELAKQQVVTFYMHPHMAVCRQHWDYVFRNGNLHPFGKWPFAEARDPADTAVYYERIKAFLQKLKADSRFEVTDCPSLHAAQNPRKAITRAEIPAIHKSLKESFGPVRKPGEWSIADCFLAAVGILRGDAEYAPGKTYGFLYAPEGVKKPVRVKTADLAAAAKRMDVSRFLPVSIDVGGTRIGPADFLFAALEAIETGVPEVMVTPKDQLGDIAYYLPKLATVNFKGTWIYTPEYQDNWTSNRLRWQFWTFRYERSSSSQ